jgi:hypothetical protein
LQIENCNKKKSVESFFEISAINVSHFLFDKGYRFNIMVSTYFLKEVRERQIKTE